MRFNPVRLDAFLFYLKNFLSCNDQTPSCSTPLHNIAEQNYIEHHEFNIMLKFPIMEIGLFGLTLKSCPFNKLRQFFMRLSSY